MAYVESKEADMVFIQVSHTAGEEGAITFKKGWVGKVCLSSYPSNWNEVIGL